MTTIKKYIGNLYLAPRFYLVGTACIVLFIGSFFFPSLLFIPKAAWYIVLVLVLIDYAFLFLLSPAPAARRITAERFSNGDENKVTLVITNTLRFAVEMEITDDLPVQFQKRDWVIRHAFKAGVQKNI